MLTERTVEGDTYGRLTILEVIKQPGRTHVRCQCVCGVIMVRPLYYLTCGDTRSCGCLRREVAGTRSRGRGPSAFGGGRHKQKTTKTYRSIGRVRQGLHRWRAEQALGRALPPGAIVHHADGTRSDDAPLVICQSHAYHAELHRKMRVRAAGGHPWIDRLCGRCHQAKPANEFPRAPSQASGYFGYCHGCTVITWQLLNKRAKDTLALAQMTAQVAPTE